MTRDRHAEYLWHLAGDLAAGIYRTTPPAEHYARRVQRLVWGTAIHESDGLQARRQYGYGAVGHGGHGICQFQANGAEGAVEFLRRDTALADHFAEAVFGGQELTDWYDRVDTGGLLQWLVSDDRLSLALCRVYYLRDPQPVPVAPDDMATAWGRWYNTRRSAVANAQWRQNFEDWTQRIGVA